MNIILPFFLEKSSIRGRLTRLDDLISSILERHQYPSVINHFLSELITLAVTLSNAFKFEGIFTLQVQGHESPVKFMVAEITSEGDVRACANFHTEDLPSSISIPSLLQLFGSGYLAFTIDQGEHTERYQGIVELQGNTLKECLQHYFHQSEQLDAAFFLSTNEKQQSCCIMLQKLPNDPLKEEESSYDDWVSAVSFLSTLKQKEVFSGLSSEEILHRLFWEQGLQCFEAKPLRFKCRCNQEKLESVLKTLSEEERQSIIREGKIFVTCDFCSKKYSFDA